MNLNEWASWGTLGAFLLSVLTVIFSARRWLVIKASELKAERFQTYHRLVHNVSVGASEYGQMKLTSQLAYVYELRNFPEYSHLTETILGLLRREWGEREAGEKKQELMRGIDETLAFLQRQK